jgi:uncharacterized repeat protein (TIGR02543 family)
MTKVEALHEVITALGGTPEGTTVSECIAEITTIEGGAPTAGASTSDAIHELALALGYEPGPGPEPPEPPTPGETYTISFDPNGGDDGGVTIDPISVTVGAPVTLPNAGATYGWTKTGYIFGGWVSPAESTTPVDDPYYATGGVTLYAYWELN